MIVVRVEMWPGGLEEEAYPLGTVHLANDVATTIADRRRGSYDVKAFGRNGHKLARQGRVENFPRQSYPVLTLVRRALESLGF